MIGLSDYQIFVDRSIYIYMYVLTILIQLQICKYVKLRYW